MSFLLIGVIPIPKPGKDPTNPINYQPIAMTSCICKTMERMLNCRLIWYLESHNLLTNVQRGSILLDLKRFARKLSSIIST